MIINDIRDLLGFFGGDVERSNQVMNIIYIVLALIGVIVVVLIIIAIVNAISKHKNGKKDDDDFMED